MFTFTDALILAAEAHRNQKDDGGIDYIKHPLYIYHKVKSRGANNETQMAAILHDSIEDGNVTFEQLTQRGCPTPVIEALKLLTHLKDEIFIRDREKFHIDSGMPSKDAHKLAKNEEYYKYIKNLSKNEIAKAVKIEDLKHNADIRRPPQKIDNDYYSKRIAKYTAALKMLNGGIVGHT